MTTKGITMKLYADPLSTASRPVLLLVHDHSLPVDEITVSLHLGEHRSPAFLALNPNGAIPVLVDDDFVLTESVAILRYLARRFELPVYPADLRGQARVDQMMNWFVTNFHLMHCVFGTYPKMLPELGRLDPATLRDFEMLGTQGSRRYLGVLDGQLAKTGPFVCGQAITLADYAGIAQVTLADYCGFDFSPWPNVARWIDRMRERPGWDAAFAGFAGLVTATRRQTAHEPA